MGRAYVISRVAVVALGLAVACGPPTLPPYVPGVGGPPIVPGAHELGEAPAKPRPSFDKGVTVRLQRSFPGGTVLSFGLPVPRTVTVQPEKVRVLVNGAPVAGAKVKPILWDWAPGAGASATKKGVRSLLVQVPGALMTKPELDVEVVWQGAGPPPGADVVPYAQVKRDSPQAVDVAERAIEQKGQEFSLVVKKASKKTLYPSWEPAALPLYPDGYLTQTAVFGELVSRDDVRRERKWAGLAYLSDALRPFAEGAMYDEGYPVKPEAVVDPVTTFEGWLYDRCATFLLAYAHLGDEAKLRHGLKACAYYGSKIRRKGPDAGTFGGKPDPDLKYSHLRGLYIYYALTGDEEALASGKLIADALLEDKLFTAPYRKGATRGPDKLWTERLLAVDLESMVYGLLMFGDGRYAQAYMDLFNTAFRHVTTKDPRELQAITKVNFPPQDCFVHSAEQHGEGDPQHPWCSGWMSELLVDPLLRWQELTGEPRVDEVFVRLARALRDRGTNYFLGDPQGDTFLQPKVCFDPNVDDPRMLVPLYGFGVYPNGSRKTFGEWADFEHCADATVLTAAAIRSLKRQKKWDGPGVGPFKTEGASFIALHEELSACARRAFKMWSRPGRDPQKVEGRALEEGFAFGLAPNQAEWLEKQKIGYPIHESAPTRKISWWFNGSLAQYRLLEEAGVDFPTLNPGVLQAPGCKTPPAGPR
jgi:hypothetical protein